MAMMLSSKCSKNMMMLVWEARNAGLNFKGCIKCQVFCWEKVDYFLMTVLNALTCMGKDGY